MPLVAVAERMRRSTRSPPRTTPECRDAANLGFRSASPQREWPVPCPAALPPPPAFVHAALPMQHASDRDPGHVVWDVLRELLSTPFRTFALDRGVPMPCPDSEDAEASGRAVATLRLLQWLFTEGAGDDPTFKGLVFVERVRDTARLAGLIQHVGQLAEWPVAGGGRFEVGCVTGGTSMSDPVREAALAAFRRGRYRLLVCTAVLEEGLDVPDCAFAVRFDRVTTSKSHIQGSGRPRRPDAVVYYLCNDPAAEEARAQAMLDVAADDARALSQEERARMHAAAAALEVPGVHPFRGSADADPPEAELNVCNALQLVYQYTQQVRTACGDKRPFHPDQIFRPSGECLSHVTYPAHNGEQIVTAADVERHWGGVCLTDVVPPEVCRKWTRADRQKRRFLYVVAVEMRRRGHLTAQNRASPLALCGAAEPGPAAPAGGAGDWVTGFREFLPPAPAAPRATDPAPAAARQRPPSEGAPTLVPPCGAPRTVPPASAQPLAGARPPAPQATPSPHTTPPAHASPPSVTCARPSGTIPHTPSAPVHRTLSAPAHCTPSAPAHRTPHASSPSMPLAQPPAPPATPAAHAALPATTYAVPTVAVEPPAPPPPQPTLTSQEDAVINALSAASRPLTALEVAERCGLEGKHDVNRTLYALGLTGVLEQLTVDGSPRPVWRVRAYAVGRPVPVPSPAPAPAWTAPSSAPHDMPSAPTATMCSAPPQPNGSVPPEAMSPASTTSPTRPSDPIPHTPTAPAHRTLSAPAHCTPSAPAHRTPHASSPSMPLAQPPAPPATPAAHAALPATTYAVPTVAVEPPAPPPPQPTLTSQEDAVINALSAASRPLTALEVAERCGLEGKHDVNRTLYALGLTGVLEQLTVDGSPRPVWRVRAYAVGRPVPVPSPAPAPAWTAPSSAPHDMPSAPIWMVPNAPPEPNASVESQHQQPAAEATVGGARIEDARGIAQGMHCREPSGGFEMYLRGDPPAYVQYF